MRNGEEEERGGFGSLHSAKLEEEGQRLLGSRRLTSYNELTAHASSLPERKEERMIQLGGL